MALAIAAFDEPAEIAPTIQWGIEAKLPYVDEIRGLPRRGDDGRHQPTRRSWPTSSPTSIPTTTPKNGPR